MKRFHFFSLFILLIFSLFLLKANGEVAISPSPNSINISKFSGIWSGFIATYPEGNKSTEICIKCDNMPQCTNNQILIQRTCTKCAYCVDKTNNNIWNFITDFLGGIITSFENIASTLGINLQSPSQTPSPSLSPTTPTVSPGPLLSNIKVPSLRQLSASGSISLNLITKNGELKGTVNAGNLISTGSIISQNIISSEEIQVNIKDKSGKVILLKLKLFGQPSFTGIFADGVLIEGKRFTPFYSYLVPSKIIKTPQPEPSIQSQPSPKSTPKPTPSPIAKPQVGRPGGSGRAGGDLGGRAGGENSGRAGGENNGRAGGNLGGRSGGENGGRAGGEDE